MIEVRTTQLPRRRLRAHLYRHHRAQAERDRAGEGARRRRSGLARALGIPRDDEPRNPHADERRARADRQPARIEPRRRPAQGRPRRSRRRATACSASSTTSSIFPSSTPASWSSKRCRSRSNPSSTIPRASCRCAPSKKGSALSVDIDPDLPKALIGDPSRIRQIVLNLASNAVKFTPSGDVVISAHCVERERDQRDGAHRGQGFRHRHRAGPGRAPVLGFRPGRRLDPSAVWRDRPRACDLQAAGRSDGRRDLGRVRCRARARPSRSRFRCALADVADLEQRGAAGRGARIRRAAGAARPAAAGPDRGGQRDQSVRRHPDAARVRHRPAHRAATASRPWRRRSRAISTSIFMDMRMPEMDGLEATRAIRAHGGALATMPIIALTANAFADDVKACRDAGMNDFVAKPIRKRLLVEKLAKIAQAAVAADAGRAVPAAAPAPAPDGAGARGRADRPLGRRASFARRSARKARRDPARVPRRDARASRAARQAVRRRRSRRDRGRGAYAQRRGRGAGLRAGRGARQGARARRPRRRAVRERVRRRELRCADRAHRRGLPRTPAGKWTSIR